MISKRSPGIAKTRFLWQLPLIGLCQGLLLWALAYGPAFMGHISSMPGLSIALAGFVWVAPLLWYWTEQSGMPPRRRVAGVLVIALVAALLPVDVRNLFASVEGTARSSMVLSSVGGDNFWPLGILVILAVHLLLGWRITGARGWDYERLFSLTWRNAVLTAVSLALTGAFFGVVAAGAGLIKLIGIDQVWNLLRTQGFQIAIGHAAFGGAFALGLARAEMLVVMRHFWLSLTAWMLPLVLLFVVVWVVMLPFTGLSLLLETRHAAALLLGMTFMGIKFANSVYQDGRESNPLGPWLSRLTRWAWPVLLVVVAVAGWALWLRVQHRGWSADRIWAALIWLLAAIYTLGYSMSAWRRGPAWMPSIGRTNTVATCAAAVSLCLVLTPWLNPENLAVRSQLARLDDGRVAPEEFDFSMVYQNASYGRPALEALAAHSATPRDKAIALLAREQLIPSERSRVHRRDEDSVTQAQLLARLKVLPAHATLDEGLLRQLRGVSSEPAWQLDRCHRANYRCAVWKTDLNRDGRPDVLLLVEQDRVKGAMAVEAYVVEQRDGHWQVAGSLRDTGEDERRGSPLSLDQWVAAIENNQVKRIVPLWNDLELSGTRWEMKTRQ